VAVLPQPGCFGFGFGFGFKPPLRCGGYYEGAAVWTEGKRHRVNLINRGGYLHEKYRVPPALIAALLAGCE
jgi:hypothetical protein